MYKSRIKDEIPEVNFARSKLVGVLQTLVEQKEDGSGSQEKEGCARLDTETEIDDYSSIATQSKKSPRVGGGMRANRKRKLGKEEVTSIDYGQYHHSCIVKLFERSVDVAVFNEDTPLYPICRAWIRNEPYLVSGVNIHSTSLTSEELETDNEASDKEGSMGFVYELPKPCIVKQEVDGVYVDMRIPSPLPSTDEPLNIHAEEIPDAEQLLVNHMQRWRQVRQKWRNAAHLNELQYADSLNIIKELYDRQNNA